MIENIPDMDDRPKHLTRGLLRNQQSMGQYGLWYNELSSSQKRTVDKWITESTSTTQKIKELEDIYGLKSWGLKTS